MATPGPGPSSDACRSAADDLDRIARTSLLVTLGALALTVVGALLLGVVPQLGFIGSLGGLTFGGIYAISWRRAVVARRVLRRGKPIAVWAAGWCRPPDGCNYGIFLDGSSEHPDVVIRLPLRRDDMERGTEGWLFGRLKPAVLGGVALLGPRGLLATGRVVSRRSTRGKWQRRDSPPNRMVQRPPENWMPPAGQ